MIQFAALQFEGRGLGRNYSDMILCTGFLLADFTA